MGTTVNPNPTYTPPSGDRSGEIKEGIEAASELNRDRTKIDANEVELVEACYKAWVDTNGGKTPDESGSTDLSAAAFAEKFGGDDGIPASVMQNFIASEGPSATQDQKDRARGYVDQRLLEQQQAETPGKLSSDTAQKMNSSWIGWKDSHPEGTADQFAKIMADKFPGFTFDQIRVMLLSQAGSGNV